MKKCPRTSSGKISSSAFHTANRSRLYLALGCLFLFWTLPGVCAAESKKPNILLIYADDLGYGDVSYYGARRAQTPNIDRLAREGLRFTDAHCSSSTCTPSRYSMLTGEYAWRRRGTGVLPGDAPLIIEPGRMTLPTVLQGAGYATGVIGKWHLGLGGTNLNWNGEIKPGPLEVGFDNLASDLGETQNVAEANPEKVRELRNLLEAERIKLRLNRALEPLHKQFDPAESMLRRPFSSPGYHTTLTGGWVHPTRDSLVYAVALLDTGNDAYRTRAEAILRRVISLQDQDPASKTFGIWPWFLEEPLEKMSPPDFNWADFCGVQLLQVALDHAARLSPEVGRLVEEAIKRAAQSIRKRNVGPGYTNIAIMGTYVTLVAAELFKDPDLLQYALARWRRFHAFTLQNGALSEYNSPTYTVVASRNWTACGSTSTTPRPARSRTGFIASPGRRSPSISIRQPASGPGRIRARIARFWLQMSWR